MLEHSEGIVGLIGALLIFVGIFGGGLELGFIKIPKGKVGTRTRRLAIGFGSVLLIGGLVLHVFFHPASYCDGPIVSR